MNEPDAEVHGAEGARPLRNASPETLLSRIPSLLTAGPRPVLLATALVVVVLAALHGPMFTDPGSWLGGGSFHASHVWCFDHIARMLGGDAPFVETTDRIGYPNQVDVRFIAWVPALIAAPLNPLVGPLAAYNLSMVASCGLAVPFVALLARRCVGASWASSAAAGALYALSPPLVGALANGQTCKAQIWTVPAVLLAIHVAARARSVRTALGALCITVVTALAAAFTEPTYCLVMALVLPFWGLAAGLQGARTPVARVSGVARAIVACALTAACFVVASRYYDVPEATSAFLPSRRLSGVGVVNQLQQQVSLDVLLGLAASRFTTTGTVHIGYVGIPALVAVAVAGWRTRARALVWVLPLLIVGIALSLGEFLSVGDAYVMQEGRRFALPAASLAELGFPLARSGQYYRALVLAWLGVALAVAALGGRAAREGAPAPAETAESVTSPTEPRHRFRSWAAHLPVVTALLLGLEGLRVTAGAWPFPVERDDGHALWARMAEDPVPGAILDLPLQIGNRSLGVNMMAGAFAGRAVPALPIWSPLAEHPGFRKSVAPIVERLRTGQPDAARATLAAAGYRYVVYRTHRPAQGPSFEEVTASLGPPERDGPFAVWVIGR